MSSNSPTTKQPDVCSILLNNDFAKSVTVPEAKQHQDGYTVYKTILQALRIKKTIEEEPLTYVAWKRFRDLHKLYRRIVIIHAQLYLKGVVPSFPKPDFFGRLEPLVVEERRQSSEQFLSFVVQNNVLCQCEAVLVFFSGAECQKSFSDNSSSSAPSEIIIPSTSVQPPPLSPSAVANVPPSFPLSTKVRSRSESSSADMSDDLSPHSPTASFNIIARRDDDAVGGSSDLLAAFDPFPSSSANIGASNYQILSEVMTDLQVSVSDNGDESSGKTSDEKNVDGQLLEVADFSQTERNLSPSPVNNTRNVKPVSKNLDEPPKMSTSTRWRSKIADFFPRLSPSSSKQSMNSKDASSDSTSELKTVKSESHLCFNNNNDSKIGHRFRTSQSIRVKSKRGGGSPNAASIGGVARRSSLDYVLQAAEFISSAQKAEEETAFDLAFTCYKSAVMLLLQGVQDEKDLNRRNAVRVKTAKYLKKAEKLYTTYIASDMNTTFCLDGFTTRFLSNFGIMGFQSVYSELAQYKVVRILGQKVQLVQDVTTGHKYVIKFLDKSCYSSSYSATKILDQCVPTRVPHMVKLVKFWDTETAAILLLEYAAGGRLWRRLRSYLEKVRRLFRDYYEKKSSGGDNEKFGHESRLRSESADNLVSNAKQREAAAFSIGFRNRSGSDPNDDRQSRLERNFSLTSEPFDDEENDEFVQAGRVLGKEDNTSLFGVYEQESMRARYSTEDSFSLDTAPSSATVGRRFSLLYSENRVSVAAQSGIDPTSDELEEFLLRKWIAQLTVALGYLHAEGVLCRDLNPDNLLLDEQDNLLLTFFCDWGGVDRPFNPRVANTLYSAPEVDGSINEPLIDAADWWSLGVILYEIATGTPLHIQCPHGVGPNTVIPLPDYLSVELRDLITRLIRYDAEDRLGSCFGGVDEIKMHPFFMGFDWHTVEPS